MLRVRELRRPGLFDASLEVAAGECVVVMGPSGSGKTLFLRALADLDPHEGQASLDGRDCADRPAHEWRCLVQYVPADSGWWGETVGEHFEGSFDGSSLERFGLDAEAVRWSVDRLSTGERQRLAVARALERDPRVLLLDEPTSGLDEQAGAAVEVALEAHLARGGMAVVVTHDEEQAQRLARRIYRLEEGRLNER